jgi:hypothetical protein
MNHDQVEMIKHVGDGISVVTVIGTLTQVLPAVAAIFTIIWTAMRIVEMITGKNFSVIIGWAKDDAERK